MWLDDRVWLPVLLAGRCFDASFDFRGHAEITRSELRVVEALPLDAATAVFVTGARQGAITC